jgi:hypothetical protein
MALSASKGANSMPRQTKAEREARQAEFIAQQEEENRNTYFPRLMKALEEASNLYWDISVKNGAFVVDDKNRTEYIVSPVYREANMWSLDDLERDIRNEQLRQAEVQRQYELRKNALAKLTEEDRKALGL